MMLEIQERIISAALVTRKCLYREQQWGPLDISVDKKFWYFDCIGEVYWVGHEADALYFVDGCEEGKKWRSYPPEPSFEVFYEALDTFLITLPRKHDAQVADILWFRDQRSLHLGIVTHVHPSYYVVHASLNRGKVMHEAVRNSGAVLRSFRYPKVQEALDSNG